MHQSLVISLLMLFGILAEPCFGQGKELFLSFPDLKDKIIVSLPEGHDSAKRYPVVFFYHGQGTQPDTSLIRFHTGPENWIVVGMGYANPGNTDLSDDAMAREMALFHKVKKVVMDKYGGNRLHLYVAGFSKGGWLADAMLQIEPSLDGGIILGAGKMREFNRMKTYHYAKESGNKEVFIGIGRNDKNYTYAYHSLMMHRKKLANVTLEIWRDHAHSIPKSGSVGLKQWLNLRVNYSEDMKKIAEKETQVAFDAVAKLSELDQYFVLRDLSKTPYVKLLGKVWEKRIDSRISSLKKNEMVSNESLAYSQKQNALFTELQYRNSADLLNVVSSYLAIQKSYPDTVEAGLIVADVERVKYLAKLVMKREGEVAPVPSEEKVEVDETLKEDDRNRIPKNPLIR